MQNSQDSINCVKNLIQLMCCDGKIASGEKKFLAAAAEQMKFDIEPLGGWSQLIKQVHKDGIDLYPVKNKQKAISTLKGLVVMANADKTIDKREKTLIQNFAKSINLGNAEFTHIIKDIDTENIFEVFAKSPKNVGSIIVLEEEFEKINDLIDLACENGITVKTTSTKAFLASETPPATIVCFHASLEKEKSIKHCEILMQKASANLICILSRHQGLQVKYLHEQGLQKCIIEPIYSRDLLDMFKK
jgi:uncharacterized tellurite resistance protein B-like protein